MPGGERFDAVVLHDTGYLDEEQLQRIMVSSRRLVLAGGVPWKSRQLARAWCAARGFSFHDVRAQGAFILEQ